MQQPVAPPVTPLPDYIVVHAAVKSCRLTEFGYTPADGLPTRPLYRAVSPPNQVDAPLSSAALCTRNRRMLHCVPELLATLAPTAKISSYLILSGLTVATMRVRDMRAHFC